MGRLWDIVQAHIDEQAYGASLRSVAHKLGMSPTAFTNWRDPRALPDPENLRALANLTGTAYSRVLDAALEDAGYLDAPEGLGVVAEAVTPGSDRVRGASASRRPVRGPRGTGRAG